MRRIRRNVFETNSSSTHSVSILSHEHKFATAACLSVDWDELVHVEFGEFGWEVASYKEPYVKLQYLVTMLVETEGRQISTLDELLETDGFKLINSAVATHCNCNGICIDSDIKLVPCDWNESGFYIDHTGYIDHQSCESYGSVQDFLDDYGCDVYDFLFDMNVVLRTDNDNH